MDQNQTVDDSLQKAIDDITNTTNSDPVFSDPVAAPSSIPEGDTGELSEPVGPFPVPPMPDAKVEMVPPAPEPIAPLQSMNIPELNIPMPTEPDLPTPPTPEVPTTPESPIATEASESTTTTTTPETIEQASIDTAPQSNSTAEIKKAALRDLVPLLDKVVMETTDKFNIYKDIFNDLKDYTVLDPAYRTAREIPDETERAKALLYLIESIDRM